MSRSLVAFLRFVFLGAILAGCATPSTETEPDVAAAPELRGPAVVWEMVEAHGGMAAWTSAPAIAFTEQWGDGPQTRVVVEQGRRRAYAERPGTNARMAWDGERAWGLDWQGAPPRFTARLTYYFIHLPWMTQDPGVRFGEPATGQLPNDSTAYTTISMTFDPGVGDTPRDSYELYIHPETKRLAACRYVMTYQAVLPPSIEQAPPSVLVFGRHETLEGLVVPTQLRFHGMDGAVTASCTISGWSRSAPFDELMVAMPGGAVVDTTTP
jgi:hypothetical protein